MTEKQIIELEKIDSERIDSERIDWKENNYKLFQEKINHLRMRLLFSLENDPAKMVESFEIVRQANNPDYKQEKVT